MDIQSIYQHTLKYATAKHQSLGQTVPGTNLPYVVHLSNVAMEILIASRHTPKFNLELAIQAALLHDVLEDTPTTFEELKLSFGKQVADAVSALTKNFQLPKETQMKDSINRIKEMQKEVWAIKLADRIANLQKPPATWNTQKKIKYHTEALTILEALGAGNKYLSARLAAKIKEYEKYFKS